MSPRESLAGFVGGGWKAALAALSLGFTAGGIVFAYNAAHMTKAEAADMLAPVAAETHANSVQLMKLGNGVDVLLGRDRVRWEARHGAKAADRDDAELDAVQVYDSEIAHGLPVEQAIAAARRR